MLASFIQHQFLNESTSPQLEQLFQRLFKTSKQASQRVRAISHSLYSVSIKRIGLNSMRYRAEIIDGELSIENVSNGGTIVTCTFDGEEEPI